MNPSAALPLARRAARYAKWMLANVPYMVRTGAPLSVHLRYFLTGLRRYPLERYAAQQAEFRRALAKGRFSDDWFSGNIPYWLAAFHRHGLFDKDIEALEIGSWEGMSSSFILATLPRARLTCVDTWAGADEHHGRPLRTIEDNFDANLAPFEGRVRKYKGTSFSYFGTLKERHAQFDLIYVDGSHYSDDVIIDAVKAFEHLKVGGLLIFDDYLWHSYQRDADNPAPAIHWFLRLKSGCSQVVSVYAQIILVKTANRHERAIAPESMSVASSPSR